MSRKELCPFCHTSVKGLYESTKHLYAKTKASQNPEKLFKLRAYYCVKCDKVLGLNEIVYKQIEYKKR